MCRLYCICRVLVLLFALSPLSGCVQSGPVGKWETNGDATRVFESKTLLQDHTYYFRGSEGTPDAVIAIDNRYTLQTKVWSKVAITQEILDDWMYWLNVDASILCPYVGGVIITPDGDTAGIWYSNKRVTAVKTPEPGVLQVYPPYNPTGSFCARQEYYDDL